MIFCVNIQKIIDKINEAIIDISRYKSHKVLGHSGEEAAAVIVKELGRKFTIVMNKCVQFQAAKDK